MGKVRVWTKQHANILNDLEENGRYIVKKDYIVQKMEEHAGLYLDVYDWYYRAASPLVSPPADVRYPVWVSLTTEGKIENSEGNVQLELEMDESQLLTMDIDKWGRIVNYMYIPADKADEQAHELLLERYGIDDITAYMSPFYPAIRQMIVRSWDRLFDDSYPLSEVRVGTLWEIQKSWIVTVTR